MRALAHHAAVARPTKAKTAPVGLRLELDILDEIDALAREMSRPGIIVTRADVIRMFVHEAVEARRRKPKK